MKHPLPNFSNSYLFPVLFIILSLCSPHLVFSEGSTTVLETIIVTDSGKESKLLDVGTSVTVFTEEDIKNSGRQSVAKLITTIPGVVYEKMGARSYINIRGTRLNGANGAIIYVDGVPINRGVSDYSQIDSIPIENIERIEVLKSPSPALYGKNASRGVILITTKKGKNIQKEFSAVATGEVSSWDTKKANVNLRGRHGRFDYSLNGIDSKTDGYRHTNNEITSVGGSIGLNFDGGRIEFVSNYIDSDRLNAGGMTEEYAINHPRMVDEDNQAAREESLSSLNSLNLTYNKNNWLLNSSLTYAREKRNLSHQSSTYQPSDLGYYVFESINPRYGAKINLGRRVIISDNILNTINIGADYNSEKYDYDYDYPNRPATYSGKTTKDYIGERDALGINAHNDLMVGIFKLETGLRLNNVKVDFDYDESGSKTDYSRDYGDDTDWNITPSVNLSENSNLFFNYVHSNVYSNMSRTSLNAGNTAYPTYPQADDLNPEIFDTIEVGFKHQYHRAFNYSIVYYRTEISDKIVAFYDYLDIDGDGNTSETKGYYNAGDSIHHGIEFEIDGRPCKYLGYNVGFSTIKAEWETAQDKNGNDLSGKQIKSVPEYEYRLGLDIYPFENRSYGSLLVNLDLYGYGKQYGDNLNQAEFEMDSAFFVDTKITYSYKNYEVYIFATNLFDNLWIRNSGSSSSYYPADARCVGVGVSIKI